MSRIMAAVAEPLQLDSVRARLDQIRATSEGPLVIGCTAPAASVVDRALRQADISRKEFVLNADANRSQVYSALNGCGGLPIGWLWAQSPAFWAAYWPLVAREKLAVSEARKAAMKSIVDALQVLALLPEGDSE